MLLKKYFRKADLQKFQMFRVLKSPVLIRLRSMISEQLHLSINKLVPFKIYYKICKQ